MVGVLAAGTRLGGESVLITALTPQITPPAAVGNVAKLLHVDVDQGAGVVVFVAADRLTGGSIEVGESVEPAPNQHLVHGGWGQADPVGDPHRSQAVLPSQVHDLAHHRLRHPVRRAVRTRGRIDHPSRPELSVAVGPPFRGRPRDVVALGCALVCGQPWSTTSRASRKRARGVRAALAWDTKTSW